MIQIQTGKACGGFGLIVIGHASTIFLILTVTGFSVYLDRQKRRRAMRKKDHIWTKVIARCGIAATAQQQTETSERTGSLMLDMYRFVHKTEFELIANRQSKGRIV
jgi:hypothetical protein